MKFQKRAPDGTDYYCGPASLQNALRHLGVRVGQERVAKLCGTTPEGTDHEQLQAGVIQLGKRFEVISTNDAVEAWKNLGTAVFLLGPVLMCVDRWAHWVCAYSYGVGRVCWFDPGKTPYNLAENGHHSATRGKLMKRWKAARRDAKEFGHTYYGIVVL